MVNKIQPSEAFLETKTHDGWKHVMMEFFGGPSGSFLGWNKYYCIVCKPIWETWHKINEKLKPTF
jgi:hypothetical protein